MILIRSTLLIACLLFLAACNTQPAKQLHEKGDKNPNQHDHEMIDQSLEETTAAAAKAKAEAEAAAKAKVEAEAAKAKAEAAKAAGPTITPENTDMVPSWVEIETHKVMVLPDAQPWTFTPAGISFQMVDSLPDPNMKLFQPIGNAILRPNGATIITFPEHDVVGYFSPANQYEAKLYGSVAFGGKGEPINNPDEVAANAKSIWIMENNQKVIAHFDKAFHLQHVVQPGISDDTNTVLYPSPDGYWMMTSKRKPTLFYKLTPERQVLVHYSLPNRDGVAEANMPQLTPYEDGKVVGIRFGGHNAFHCDEAGKIVRQFDFDFSGSGLGVHDFVEGWRGLAAAQSSSLYFFLFKDLSADESYLMRMTPDGRVVNFSAVPFPADGMSLNTDEMLLYERKSGKAQMYRLN